MFLQNPETTTRTSTALFPRVLLAGVLALSEVALAAEPLTRIADIRGLERGEPAQMLTRPWDDQLARRAQGVQHPKRDDRNLGR